MDRDAPRFKKVETPGLLGRQLETRRTRGPGRKTALHKAKLIEIFRDPPFDYDGTNAKLEQYLGLSERQIERLLKALAVEGLIKIDIQYRRRLQGTGTYAVRTIYLVDKQES